MKSNASRVGNIVCDKGRSKNGCFKPTFKEIEETSYVDFDNIVYFQKKLKEEKNINDEKIDIKKCFENFHNE